MNKKEIKTLKTTYKQQFNYFRLTKFNQLKNEYDKVKGMRTLLNSLKIQYQPWENEVIFLEKESLIREWQDICHFAKLKNEITCTQHSIEWIEEEISFTSETEQQYNARMEVIKSFKNRIESLPEY